MKTNRDDFDSKTIEALAKRVSYICSNPECRALTICPSDVNVEKYLYIGKAAHITSAAIKGPRYDATLTQEQRQFIENGIFLCATCADMIDKNNGADFSVEQLKQWKSQHESWVRSNLNRSVSSLLSTIDGERGIRPIIDICHRGISVTEVEKEKLYFDIPYCSGKSANAYNVRLETGIILHTGDGFEVLVRFGDSFPDNITLSYETGKSMSFTLNPLSYKSLSNIYIGVRGSYTNESRTSTYPVFDVFKFNRIKNEWVRTLGEEDKSVRAFFETMTE
jgi:hypothetical protein